MDHVSLASDFPPATEAEWLALVGKALGNKPFDALRTTLHEGFKTEPLYTAARPSPLLASSRGWHVIQPLTGDVKQFNDDISNGAGALSIDFGSGLSIETADQLKYFLGSDIAYYITPGAGLADAAFVLAANEKQQIAGSAGFDPLGAVAVSGELPVDRAVFLADYADAALYIREHHPSFRPFLASGHAWNGAGGSATQELAFTLAAAVSYWRVLSEAGLPLTEGARCIGFSLSACTDIFLTIAKFRAMRLLWARAVTAAGAKPPSDLLLLAQMSHRIVSAYDPHVNVLRGTAAAFGAAIGGATGIEIMPYDTECGGATLASRRLARNTSLILQQESYVSAVADAAAGSAYVEALTSELAAAAWALFREVEAKGGLCAALESGFVQDALHLKAQERERAVANRKDKITGVSVFPNLAETFPFAERISVSAASAQHPFAGRLPPLPAPGRGERFAALVVAAARSGLTLPVLRLASRRVASVVAAPLNASKRDAEPFETLRKRADAALGVIGSRPPVFLGLLGKPDGYRARASWLQSFFATGGIEAIMPDQAFESAEALAAAFKQSPAPIACLCSSNEGYSSVPGAASALKKAGAVAVYLAGPASVLKALDPQDAVSIDRLVYEGCDALALLEEAQLLLRVEELSAAAQKEAAEDGFEVHVHGPDCGCN